MGAIISNNLVGKNYHFKYLQINKHEHKNHMLISTTIQAGHFKNTRKPAKPIDYIQFF